MKTVIPYPQLRSEIVTASVLLFSGEEKVSGLIKLGTGSNKSHVALALRGVDFAALYPAAAEGLDTSRVLCWESTTLSDVPGIDGTRRQGVQTVYLSDRLAHYPGTVSIRLLDRRPDYDELGALFAFHAMIAGRDYETCVREMVCAAYDGPFGDNVECFDTVFCSELCAGGYQHMGYLPQPPVAPPANEYIPKDFCMIDCLERGQGLGPEIGIAAELAA